MNANEREKKTKKLLAKISVIGGKKRIYHEEHEEHEEKKG